jgi:hypothetical protein
MFGGKGGFQGLCARCDRGLTCTLPSSWQGPVLECPAFRPKGPAKPPVTTVVERVPAGEAAGIKGLCVTCENREVCPFPRPDTGVWHCEHYVERPA